MMSNSKSYGHALKQQDNRIFQLLSPLTQTFVTHLCISMEAPLPHLLCLCLGFQGGLRFDSCYKRTSFNPMLPKSQQCCCHSCAAFSFVRVSTPCVSWSSSVFGTFFSVLHSLGSSCFFCLAFTCSSAPI